MSTAIRWPGRLSPIAQRDWPAPDFMRPTRGRPLATWLLVAVALLTLQAAAADAWQAHQNLRQVRERLAIDPRALQPAAAQAGRSAAEGDAPGAQAWLRAQRLAQARLAWPWPEVLAAAEAASVPGITWLALAHSAEGALSLQGLAPDADAALSASEALHRALQAAPGMAWGPVLLTELQPDADTPGAPQRLAMQAQPHLPQRVQPNMQASVQAGAQPGHSGATGPQR